MRWEPRVILNAQECVFPWGWLMFRYTTIARRHVRRSGFFEPHTKAYKGLSGRASFAFDLILSISLHLSRSMARHAAASRFRIRVPGSISGAEETDLVLSIVQGINYEELERDLASTCLRIMTEGQGRVDEEVVAKLRMNPSIAGLVATADDAEQQPTSLDPVIIPLHTLCANPGLAARAVDAVGGVARLIVRGLNGRGLGAKRPVVNPRKETGEWFENAPAAREHRSDEQDSDDSIDGDGDGGAEVASVLAQQPAAKQQWVGVLRAMVRNGDISSMRADDLRSEVLLGFAPEISRAAARVAVCSSEGDEEGATAWARGLVVAVREAADAPALEAVMAQRPVEGEPGEPSAPPADPQVGQQQE